MEPKRYYFSLEVEHLLDDVWQQFNYADIVEKMGFQDKLEIVEKIETLLEPNFDNLKQTLRGIRHELTRKLMKKLALEDGWFSAEEDEAWKNF